jgi:hypothetical protein
MSKGGSGQRMFVAVVPPATAIDDLDEFLAPRRESGAFRWSLAEHFHVTLAFLPSVPDRRLDDLVERLGRARVAAARAPVAARSSSVRASYAVRGAGRGRGRVPRRLALQAAVRRPRPLRGRAHRAGPGGDRCPRRRDAGRGRGRRAAVPAARDGRPDQPAHRHHEVGPPPRRLRGTGVHGRPDRSRGVPPRRGAAQPAALRGARGVSAQSVIPVDGWGSGGLSCHA